MSRDPRSATRRTRARGHLLRGGRSIVSFSRSATTATVGCRLGQHTGAVLREFGFDEAAIADFAAAAS